MNIRFKAAKHEACCKECRVTWRSWLLRLLNLGGMSPLIWRLSKP